LENPQASQVHRAHHHIERVGVRCFGETGRQPGTADCAVKVVVNAIASIGPIIESEKPKASIAPKDLRRSAIFVPFI
jgi:hypothetical protein